MDGRREGEKALNRGPRESGVRRKGVKCLLRSIEQIVDLDEARELLPTCLDPTIHEVVTQRSLLPKQPLLSDARARQ
jgi:hypothetical protein